MDCLLVNCLAVLLWMGSVACKRVTVTRMIFNNYPNGKKTVDLTFSGKTIVENIFLIEKIKGEANVSRCSLMKNITNPTGYQNRVTEAQRASQFNSMAYKDALTDKLRIDLSSFDFQEKVEYGLKVKPQRGTYDIYTETFIYEGGILKHYGERKRSLWYANIWVWCSIGMVALIGGLLLRAFFF